MIKERTLPRPAKPGDDFRKHLSSRWFNESLKKRNKPSPLKSPLPENPVRVPCIAESGQSFDQFDCVNLAGPFLDYEDWGSSFSPQYTTQAVRINADISTYGWGIVQGPCDDSTPSEVVVLGLSWANFSYSSPDSHVKVESSQLISAEAGEGIIISPPETGKTIGLILINGASGGGIIDIRYQKPNLQYTFDGITWITWHTTVTCPTTS